MSDLMELGRRATACNGWRWMPGMRATHRWIDGMRLLCDGDGEHATDYVVRPGPDGNQVECISECGIMGSFPGADGSPYPIVPDLSDPATLGCLLALVREAWGEPLLYVTPINGGRWTVWPNQAEHYLRGDTEAEALVVALERAP